MRLTNQEIAKTRQIGRYLMELEVGQITGGEAKGLFQATYYNLADPYIWGECKETAEEAIKFLNDLVDEKAKQYPSLYGNKEQVEKYWDDWKKEQDKKGN